MLVRVSGMIEKLSSKSRVQALYRVLAIETIEFI